MQTATLKQYRQLRVAHLAIATRHRFTHGTTSAQDCLRSARILAEWDRMESSGRVRIQVLPDEFASYDDLAGDAYNPRANPDIPAARLAREEAEFRERVNRDGVWGIVGEYFNGEEWVRADSVWGFVGDDWQESGYDVDVMKATIEAAQKAEPCPTCGRPARLNSR